MIQVRKMVKLVVRKGVGVVSFVKFLKFKPCHAVGNLNILVLTLMTGNPFFLYFLVLKFQPKINSLLDLTNKIGI